MVAFFIQATELGMVSEVLHYVICGMLQVHKKEKRKRDESPTPLFQVLDVHRM